MLRGNFFLFLVIFFGFTLILLIFAFSQETQQPGNYNDTTKDTEIETSETDSQEKIEYTSFNVFFSDIFSNVSKYDFYYDYLLSNDDIYLGRAVEIVFSENFHELYEVLSNREYILTEPAKENFSEIEFSFDPVFLEKYLVEEVRNKRAVKPLDKPRVEYEIYEIEGKGFVRGDLTFGISYGSVYRPPELTIKPSEYVKEGFDIQQDMKILSKTKVGEKVDIDIQFDQKSAINKFNISYKEPANNPEADSIPVKTKKTNGFSSLSKPFVRELSFGDVSFSLQGSKYINYTALSSSAQGIKFVGKTGDLTLEVIGSLGTSVSGKRVFYGSKKIVEKNFKDFSYIRRKYFSLPDTDIDLPSLRLAMSISSSENADFFVDSIPFKILSQGTHYIFDRYKSEIELKEAIASSTYLVVFYTHHNGQPMTISSNIYMGNGSDSRTYLYLYKVGEYSPYEIKSIYFLGSLDIDLSQGFDLYLTLSSDPTIVSSFQFSQSDYSIDISKGIIRFVSNEPFKGRLNFDFYTLTRDPMDSESTYTINVRFSEKVLSYQLDFDVVEGSEEVRINNVVISKSEYNIIYPIGLLTFKNPSLINQGDVIEITYEYRPFFGGPQKINLGTISEYRPFDFIKTKFSGIFWSSQGVSTAPLIVSPSPTSGFIFALSSSLDFGKMFNLKNDRFTSELFGEFSSSLVNPNSFGSAIINDFDSSKRSFLVNEDEDAWYPSSSITNIGAYKTNRARLLYKDYREYYSETSFNLMSYSWNPPLNQILDYSFKPGPYNTSGGRLDPSQFPGISQSTIVLDYDFRYGEWVGIVTTVSKSGIDFSDLQEIVVWYRMEMDNNFTEDFDSNNTNEVQFYVLLGRASEDIDEDNILDREFSASDSGFAFSGVSNEILTWVGRGRKTPGNGRIDSEDFDGNGRLDTEQEFAIFPYSGVNISGSGWKKVSISIGSLTSQYIEILKKVKNVVLVIKKVNGLKGRVIVDEILFKFKLSTTVKVDGIKFTSSVDQLSVSSISVYDSPRYQKNRFFDIEATSDDARERRQEFSHLHGTAGMSISEARSLDESSLRLFYVLSNQSINTNFSTPTGGLEAVAVNSLFGSTDYSKYSKIVMYVFIPTKDDVGNPIKSFGDTFNDESIVVRYVSKEGSYFEWLVPIDRLRLDTWNRLEIRIYEDYKLILNNNIYDNVSCNVVGAPSWRDITSLELGVRVRNGTSEYINIGEVWFNELFLTDVRWKISSAFNTQFSLNYYDILLNVYSFPILSNFRNYIVFENIFPNFLGNGGKENANVSSLSYSGGIKLFKFFDFDTGYSYSSDFSVYDSISPVYLYYTNYDNSFRYSLVFSSPDKFIPNFSYAFSYKDVLSKNNGILSSGTNYYLRVYTQNKLFLGSRFSADYQIPFSDNISFPLKTSFEVLSSFSVENQDTRTNDIYFYSFPSHENYHYTLNFKLSGNSSWLNLDNTFSHSESFTVSSNYPFESYDKLTSSGIHYANVFSFNLLREGFVERGFRREVIESDTLSLILPNYFNFLTVYLTPFYEFKDFNFIYSTNQNRDTSMVGKITYRFDLGVRRLNINTISLSTSYETRTYVNSIDYSIKWFDLYTNNIYRGVIAIPFWEYQGIWGYDNLESALNFSTNLSVYRSVISLISYLGFSISLDKFEDLILGFVPNNISFDYSTYTSRELSSYRQFTKLSFFSSSSVPIYKINWFIFRRDKENTGVSVNDLGVSLRFSRTSDFNTRIQSDEYSASSSFSGIVFAQNNYSVSYSITYSPQDVITNLPSFYSNFGVGLYEPQFLQNKISHTIKISYNFSTPTNESVIDLIFVKLSMNTRIDHSQELSFYTERVWYNKNTFTPFYMKEFEVNFQHTSSFNYSEFVKGSVYLKFMLNRIIEVSAVDMVRREKYFDITPGFEFGFNLRVVF